MFQRLFISPHVHFPKFPIVANVSNFIFVVRIVTPICQTRLQQVFWTPVVDADRDDTRASSPSGRMPLLPLPIIPFCRSGSAVICVPNFGRGKQSVGGGDGTYVWMQKSITRCLLRIYMFAALFQLNPVHLRIRRLITRCMLGVYMLAALPLLETVHVLIHNLLIRRPPGVSTCSRLTAVIIRARSDS